MLWILRLSLAFVVTIALAACGSSSTAPTTTQSFAVTAKEFGFAPAQLTVTAGQPVELIFQNTGAVEHDWSVREIDLAGNPTATEVSGGHMTGDMHDTPKLHVAAGPNAQTKLTFTPSKAGTYEVLCTVAGHKEAGMVGTLTVTAP
ncbi:MAG TPA: cupredoxin domain-containing protein [Roseiflexaceae bacterium]|nr:cupredoxin domain-containing protein [Roseiflexaceae bacterium]